MVISCTIIFKRVSNWSICFRLKRKKSVFIMHQC
nr:MAG TPA: hypothetical protein [Caudoviricetes sp.]